MALGADSGRGAGCALRGAPDRYGGAVVEVTLEGSAPVRVRVELSEVGV